MDDSTTPRGRFRSWRQEGLYLATAAAVVLLLALALLRLAAPGAAIAGAAALVVVALIAQRRAAAPVEAAVEAVGAASAKPPFELMLEFAADPILLVSGADPGNPGDRRFLFANVEARDLLRLQRPEGLLTTALRAPEVLSAVEEALFGKGATEAVWQSRGVQERFWRALVRPLPAPAGGGPSGTRLALLTLRDETEMRRGEALRADFLANASHELRTPLASLTGFVETLRGHAKDDEGARDRFLEIMHVQADRMRRLIEDLMSLSRIELGEHIRPSGRVEVGALVRDVIDALAPQALERGVRIELRPEDPADAGAEAAADRDQLVQVAQNLIENAIKYAASGGLVTVETRAGLDALAAAAPSCPGAANFSLLKPEPAPGRRFVLLRVRDTGPGIARNHLPRLAERFYRVEGQKARPGTGLGLAIVKHIVNRHRGGLTVESVVGAGSVFTVYVPMAEPLEPETASAVADT